MHHAEQEFSAVAEAIYRDYAAGKDLDASGSGLYPDKEGIIDTLSKLVQLLFPGLARVTPSPAWVTDALRSLTGQLIPLLHGFGEPDPTPQARELSLAFFREIPHLRALLRTDLYAAFEADPAATSHEEIISCYPGFFAIAVHRLAHELHALNIPLMPRVMAEYAHSITGIDIHPGAVIGESFFIDHGTGIVIGETAVIGRNVKIYQGVTLGALSTRGGQSLREQKRHPTIEDRVTIYSGASIFGGETVIGRDSVIGANAFITHSIPPCTKVTIKSQELLFRPRICRDCPKAPPAGG